MRTFVPRYMMKKLIYILYTLLIVCIGFATVIERLHGTPFAAEHVYDAWWFSALWVALTVVSCAFIIRKKLYKRLAVMLLHMAFVVILIGALTTHLSARRGTVRLRKGLAEITYIGKENRVEHLPFSLTLKEFRVINYPGTDAPLDYQSVIEFTIHNSQFTVDNGELLVSMNHIGNVDGYRLFQQSYDSDGEGVTLGVSYDPYGIGITYAGYLMLLVGIIATLLSRRTRMRALYRQAMTIALLFFCINASAATTVDEDIAHRLGTVNVLYNNRICPLNTVATDFVMKLTGSASWEGHSADEIFVGWMIYYSPWEQQKLIRIKSRQVRELLGIDGQWASYADFLNAYHEYKLEEAIAAARQGDGQISLKELMEADEKFHLIEMFYRGELIRMFPVQLSSVNWYKPGTQVLPQEIPVKEQFFIKQSMDFLTEAIVTGQRDRAFEIIAKIKLFQRSMIGDLLPSERATQAEIFYNKLRSQKWPVFLALTLSLLLCVVFLMKNGQFTIHNSQFTIHNLSFFIFHFFIFSFFLYVSLLLGLRWWLSGHIPVSNGHETMLFMAWVALLLPVVLRASRFIQHLTTLVASFCLLVAMLAGNATQITPLMPVLQSPLLSIHVMTVMCAYALFALQMFIGVFALLIVNCKLSIVNCPLPRLTALSQFLLYPAVFLLTVGIFLGAVWANVSWGNYWSWDPKESWALITMMVYAVPLHFKSLSTTRYHLYMVAAFLVVIITYFGVNYLLGGLHSYA